MKAITIRQPWAWAILCAGKDVENRTRNIAGAYRGPLLIHSSGRKPNDAGFIAAALQYMVTKRLLSDEAMLKLAGTSFLPGCVLGSVDLDGVHHSEACGDPFVDDAGEIVWPECSRWAMPEQTHLTLSNPHPLRIPYQWPGKLGLWEFPDELLVGRW